MQTAPDDTASHTPQTPMRVVLQAPHDVVQSTGAEYSSSSSSESRHISSKLTESQHDYNRIFAHTHSLRDAASGAADERNRRKVIRRQWNKAITSQLPAHLASEVQGMPNPSLPSRAATSAATAAGGAAPLYADEANTNPGFADAALPLPGDDGRSAARRLAQAAPQAAATAEEQEEEKTGTTASSNAGEGAAALQTERFAAHSGSTIASLDGDTHNSSSSNGGGGASSSSSSSSSVPAPDQKGVDDVLVGNGSSAAIPAGNSSCSTSGAGGDSTGVAGSAADQAAVNGPAVGATGSGSNNDQEGGNQQIAAPTGDNSSSSSSDSSRGGGGLAAAPGTDSSTQSTNTSRATDQQALTTPDSSSATDEGAFVEEGDDDDDDIHKDEQKDAGLTVGAGLPGSGAASLAGTGIGKKAGHPLPGFPFPYPSGPRPPCNSSRGLVEKDGICVCKAGEACQHSAAAGLPPASTCSVQCLKRLIAVGGNHTIAVSL